MYVKTFNYVDYNGNQRSDECCFHLNKAEILKWTTTSGSYSMTDLVNYLSQKGDGKSIVKIFEELIDLSYGKKSLDGKRFMKSPEILAEFKESEAYPEFFMELCGDTNKAIDFFLHVVPKEMVDEMTKAISEHRDGVPAEMMDYVKPMLVDATAE